MDGWWPSVVVQWARDYKHTMAMFEAAKRMDMKFRSWPKAQVDCLTRLQSPAEVECALLT